MLSETATIIKFCDLGKEGLQNTTLTHWCFLPEGLFVYGQ